MQSATNAPFAFETWLFLSGVAIVVRHLVKKNLIWTQGNVVKIHGLESRFPGPLLFGSIRAKKETAAFRCFE